MKTFRSLVAAMAALTSLAPATLYAQPTTLRLHHMLSAQSAFSRLGLEKWARKIERDSHGQIRVELHPSMELGGKPADLYDQARDGTVDLSWIVLGYTPDRFPSSSTFELPFMVRSARQTSRALERYCETRCTADFSEVKVIAWHSHGPALIHASKPIERLEDLAGLTLRPGSAAIGQFLGDAGANTVAMPAPNVYAALRDGKIEATTIPWSSEVNTDKPVGDFLHFHTAAGGSRGLYTQTFALVMNPAAYQALPAKLRAVIDRNSGLVAATLFGAAMDRSDRLGRKIAQARGDRIITLDATESARWRERATPVVAAWRARMTARGLAADAMLAQANALLDGTAESGR